MSRLAAKHTKVTWQTPAGFTGSSVLLRGQGRGDEAMVELIRSYDPVVWARAKLPLHEVSSVLAEYDRDGQRDGEYLPGPEEPWA